MKNFLEKDYLLESEVAKQLYFDYAAKMPIFDFHCHLSPKEIYENKKFNSITEVWLGGDHYKWRALRASGVSEDYITGNKSPYEKFLKWAEVLPTAVGNPLYIWSHLELRQFFNIDTNLSPKTAEEVYNECNKKLTTLTARQMIELSNVKTIFTTDDPLDSLEYHLKIKEDKSFKVNILPAFRPDKAINIELSWYKSYIENLSKVVGYSIDSLDKLELALSERIAFFDSVGCCASDHALDIVVYEDATKEEVTTIFKKGLAQEKLSISEIKKYKGYILVFLGKQYKKYNWVQEYHIGALRNLSSRSLKELGPDTGFDAINDGLVSNELALLLNKLDETDELPKTMLFCLNDRDQAVLATIMGCFQKDGKMQLGSGWWFNDQLDGMNRQMEVLSQLGLISRFVGMLTDSRSFLSYPRHELFRRILCNKLGHLVESGLYPNDIETLGKIVENISYNNAVEYFKK